MFRTILVAIDGSDHARSVLAAAADLAMTGGATLHVVCVVDPSYFLEEPENGRPTADDEISYPAPAIEREAADGLVRDAVSALRRRGLAADGAVVPGEPAERIVATAADRQADVVVLGHRHLSWLGCLAERSVCHEVLERMSRPVLVVP